VRKLTTNDVKVAIANTVKSIRMSAAGGKLASRPGTHAINRLEYQDDICGNCGEVLHDEDLASLLAERLAMQGFVLYHDEDAAREYLSQGLARVEGFLRE
jgi:hypothetical protein